MDIKSAFLNTELEEKIYLDQPQGFKQGNLVCKLNKSLYRLKQSPRVWNQSIHKFFTEYDFHYIYLDHRIYINLKNGIIVGIWVDDLIIIGDNIDLINQLKQNFKSIFEMKDLGELTFFLRMQIIRDQSNRTIHINQYQYINKILHQFQMQDCHGVFIPLIPNIKLTKSTDEEPYNLIDYQKTIGSLMYVMLGTQPDLAYAVSTLSQFSSNPNQTHWNA